MGAHLPVQVSPGREPNMGLDPLLFGGLLQVLNCRKSVLLVFRLFSEIVVLYVVVVSVSSWDNVSSGSSYSTILIQTL